VGELVNEDGVYLSLINMSLNISVGILIFPYMMEAMSTSQIYILFALANLAGLIFVVFVLKETKGLTPIQI
jgi:hypothetical protein